MTQNICPNTLALQVLILLLCEMSVTSVTIDQECFFGQRRQVKTLSVVRSSINCANCGMLKALGPVPVLFLSGLGMLCVSQSWGFSTD